MKKNSNYWPHFFVIFGFLLLAILFFWPFAEGKLSFIWDTREFGFINLHQVTAALSKGYFPLWNAGNFSGYPFAGDIEAGMFYPVNWLFALIFGAIKFFQLSYYFILQFFIGAVLAYALCYKLTKNVWAGFVSGIVFAFSGYALGHISHLGQITMYMWLPGVFLTYIIALKRRKLLYTLLAGLTLGIALLVGHSNTTVYILMGLFLLTVYKMVAFREWRRLWFKTGLHSLIATVFAFMVAAVLVLPVYEFTELSNRTELTYQQQSDGWSLNPFNLLGLFDADYNHVLSENPMDDFNGSVDITQNYFYIGLLPLVFMIFGLFSRSKYRWFFVILGLMALFAAFGKYTPVNFLLFKFFPGFNKARMAVQITGLCFLAASVMVAFGAEKIFAWIMRVTRKEWGAIFIAVVCLVIIVDIFYHGFNKRFYSETIAPYSVFDDSYDLKLVSSLNPGDFRPFRISDEQNLLLQNKWEYYGIENIWGNGGIKIKKYNDLFNRLDRTHWRIIDDDLYDFLNVKYIFSKRNLDSKHFGKMTSDGVDFYENLKVLPRAYFVEKFIVEKNENKQLQLLKSGVVDFREEVLLKEAPIYFGDSGVSSVQKADFLVKDSNYLKIEASVPKSAILVLSEVDYSGWNLYVDGEYKPYMVANYVFRAVPLNPGEHIVEFKYEPVSVMFGAVVSVFSLFLFIIVAIFYFFKKKDA